MRGSCCAPATPACRARHGASTISPCSTRRPSSPAVAPGATATSWSTRHRTSRRCSSAWSRAGPRRGRSPSWATWRRPPDHGPTGTGARCASILAPAPLDPSTPSSPSGTGPRAACSTSASRLLPVAAPGVRPTSSIRPGGPSPRSSVPPDEVPRPLAEAPRCIADHTLVAVIAPAELVPNLVKLARRRRRSRCARTRRHDPSRDDRPGSRVQGPGVRRGRRRRAGGDRRRDEPAACACSMWRMTRPIQHLSVVHAPPLPSPAPRLRRRHSPRVPYDPGHGRWTARWHSSPAGATASAKAWPGIWPREGAHVVLADIDDARGKSRGRRARRAASSTPTWPTRPPARPRWPRPSTAFGGLHIAHLNAGVTSWCGMGDDFDPEAYRRSMAINLDGVVYGIAAARPAIKASGGGTIVATASMAGLVAAPFDPIYAANKHAVVGLVRSLGRDVRRRRDPSPRTVPVFRLHEHHQGIGADAARHGIPDHRGRRRRGRLPAHPRFRDAPASAGTSWRDGRASRSSSGALRGRASTERTDAAAPASTALPTPRPRLRTATIEARNRRWVPPGARRPEPPTDMADGS